MDKKQSHTDNYSRELQQHKQYRHTHTHTYMQCTMIKCEQRNRATRRIFFF